MDDAFRRNYVSKEGNKLLISEAGVAELINRLNEVETDTENRNSQNANATRKPKLQMQTDPIAILQRQLAVKDEQIASLSKLLDQSQQLQLHTQGQLDAANKELEKLPENATRNSQLANQTEKAVTQQVSGKRKGWFSRIFGSK